MWSQTLQQTPGANHAHIAVQDAISLFNAMAAADPAAFPRAVMGLMRPMMPISHCAVFVFRAGRAPALAYEASEPGQTALPQDVGNCYVGGHYRSDALTRFIGNLDGCAKNEMLAFEQSYHDITDLWYLQNCYQRCRVIDRLSLVIPAAAGDQANPLWLALNLYRTRGTRPFSVQELHDAQGLLSVAATAVKTRHLLSSDSASTTMAVPGGAALSRREAQVADLVAEGLSSREIADRLGILPSTVTTLRRRAYDKLKVANGKALAAKWAGS